jgi:hypothetical protein
VRLASLPLSKREVSFTVAWKSTKDVGIGRRLKALSKSSSKKMVLPYSKSGEKAL